MNNKLLVTLCALGFLAFWPSLVQAQSRHGLFNITEIGYGQGVGKIDYGKMGGFPNEGRIGRLRTTFGHFLTPNMSLGAGIGLDGYTGSDGPNYNTMPVYADFRAYLRESVSSPFAFINAGHSIKIGEAFESGVFGAIGAGYKKGFSRWGSLLLSGNVNLHQIKDDQILFIDATTFEYHYEKQNILLYSVSFNIGLLIK